MWTFLVVKVWLSSNCVYANLKIFIVVLLQGVRTYTHTRFMFKNWNECTVHDRVPNEIPSYNEFQFNKQPNNNNISKSNRNWFMFYVICIVQQINIHPYVHKLQISKSIVDQNQQLCVHHADTRYWMKFSSVWDW